MSNKRIARQRRKIRKIMDRHFYDWLAWEDNLTVYIINHCGYLLTRGQLRSLFYSDATYLKPRLTEYQLKLRKLI